MSSRAKDSERLAALATKIHEIAGGCVKLVGALELVSNDLRSAESKLQQANDDIDDLERRLLALERPTAS